MPDKLDLPKPDDPLAALRAGIATHARLTEAAIQAGADAKANEPAPLDTTEATP